MIYMDIDNIITLLSLIVGVLIDRGIGSSPEIGNLGMEVVIN